MHGIVRVSCSNGLDTASSSIGSRAWSGGGAVHLATERGQIHCAVSEARDPP
jgi:hypothetical protein